MPSEAIAYAAAERPDVEVLWEGTWCPGEVRMVRWVDGVEVHNVQYLRPGDLSRNIDDFTAGHVRRETVERSVGRH